MQRYALLVGVENYRDQMISRLQFARADATALADRLRNRCGFDQVRLLADESGENEPLLSNILMALRDTAAEVHEDDLLLFFFAGHGIEKDGHGYLMASDTCQAFPEHGSLSLELLRKNLERLCAGKRILLLDACRNDPSAGRADASNCMGDVISRDIVAAARARLAGGTTTALLSACRSGQRAYEWPAMKHGVFTQYLLDGLDGAAWSDGGLEFSRLANYAATRVRQWSASTPGIATVQEPWFEQFGHPDMILLATGPRKARAAPPDARTHGQVIAPAGSPVLESTAPVPCARHPSSACDCPACGKRLRIDEKLAGRAVACPGCKARLEVCKDPLRVALQAGKGQQDTHQLRASEAKPGKRSRWRESAWRGLGRDGSVGRADGAVERRCGFTGIWGCGREDRRCNLLVPQITIDGT